MSLKDLTAKIGELIADYNKDAAYDEDERIGAVQVMLTRPAERVVKGKPASLYITTREFTAKPTKASKEEVESYTVGPATVTYSYASSSIQCCAPGWVGLVDPSGRFYACFPVPGACAGFPQPYPCAV